MSESKKAAFVKHPDPDVFVRQERDKRRWMRHSVAIMVLGPRVDQIALVLPKKANARGDTHVRVPPQRRLADRTAVKNEAFSVLRELLTIRVPRDDLHYLGTGRGDSFRGGTLTKYGRYVHFVGIHLHKTQGVFNKKSEEFLLPHWYTPNQLLSMDTFAMLDSEYRLTLQALVSLSALGVEGKIIKQARQLLPV